METPADKTKAVKSPRKRRGFGMLFNLLLLIAIIAVIGAFVWAEQQRRAAREELEQTAQELRELRESSQRTGQEVAQQVLERVRRHIDIPTDPEPTVATIVDIEALKAANEFYSPAENGDHLIITERRAILYDPDRDIILDTVPVQLNTADNVPEGEDDGTGELGATPTPTAGDPSPSPTATAAP